MAHGIEMAIYGVRGSLPISGSGYTEFGGNTASYTIRTPANSLIFLDAGTGLRVAEKELDRYANKVYLLISHTHADHIQGLGMSSLCQLNTLKGYENHLVQIIGPTDIISSLSKYYDGDIIWPVKFTPNVDKSIPRMAGIDYEKILEFPNTIQGPYVIDEYTTIEMMGGNHPVRNGVVLYKISFHTEQGNYKIVYATDNEFDYVQINHPNPNVDDFKERYLKFIEGVEYLIADAQYTDIDYNQHFQGYGHSYHQQVIHLASKSNVKNLILTHHHIYDDDKLRLLEKHLQNHIVEENLNLSLSLAREGVKFKF